MDRRHPIILSHKYVKITSSLGLGDIQKPRRHFLCEQKTQLDFYFSFLSLKILTDMSVRFSNDFIHARGRFRAMASVYTACL